MSKTIYDRAWNVKIIKIAIEREQGQKLCEFYKYPLP